MIGKERVDGMTRMEKWENEVLQLINDGPDYVNEGHQP